MQGTSSCERLTDIKGKIEAIPGAMRQMGWGMSAALMERWIHSPAWVLPSDWKGKNTPDPRGLSSGHLDQQTVRMSWALANSRVRIAVNALHAKMANGPARGWLAERVASLPWGAGDRMPFGSLKDSAIQLDRTCQSNFEAFGDEWDTMDDLCGSLGMATMKVALIGEARRDVRTGKLSLQVSHAGFYIRDTYDFNDFQYPWSVDEERRSQ